ncbi:hypothetical protein [Streptomyces flaveolus]|uniref:hypothetical protein n=1 Tax=Streptomyces flaveolus TaxID=67297 RepID=UPI003700842C
MVRGPGGQQITTPSSRSPGGLPGGEGLHIGQSVASQRYLFRARPGQDLTLLADWTALINHPDMIIRNETGREVSAHEMQETTTATTGRHGLPLRPGFRRSTEDRYLTSGGHAFSRRAFRRTTPAPRPTRCPVIRLGESDHFTVRSICRRGTT